MARNSKKKTQASPVKDPAKSRSFGVVSSRTHGGPVSHTVTPPSSQLNGEKSSLSPALKEKADSISSPASVMNHSPKVKRKIDLVYGGGSVGLMGLISRRVSEGGCHVLGIIPKALMPIEISGETVGEVRIVADMHERKAAMAQEAEAFIALPGGYGTMEELLEIITWAQLGIHKKTIGLLNVDGYYNNLLALFDTGVEEGFIKPGARDIIVSAPSARELMVKMELYTPSQKHIALHQSWKVEQLGDYPVQHQNKP